MRSAGFLGIWTAMMAAMMVPTTVPLLRLDHAAARSLSRLAAITAGYLSVWIGFGCVVLFVDVLLDERLLGMHGQRLTAAFLTVAALYQVLPLKRRCLIRCRAPLGRMLLGWRDGLAGGARLGLSNGLWCAGCCVGLMAALLGLGVMSIAWMTVVGVAIAVEKLTPIGLRQAAPSPSCSRPER